MKVILVMDSVMRSKGIAVAFAIALAKRLSLSTGSATISLITEGVVFHHVAKA